MDASVITSTTTIVNPQLTAAVHDFLYSALQLVSIGAATLVSYGAKIWINSMNSKWKQAIASRVVKYAEQRIIGNPAKLEYAKTYLKEHFPRLADDEVEHLVEEAVNNLSLAESSTLPTSSTPPTAS